jgi:endoglucanase
MINILSELCSLPTAPFAEHRVIEHVKRFVSQRPRLRLSQDKTGNLLIQWPGKTKSPRLVFVAHMDHPGFIARKMVGPGNVEADFYGGVLSEYVKGAKVRFFDADQETVGQVVATEADKERVAYLSRATIKIRQSIPPGSIGMFDQGESRTKSGKFYSRVCDDLAGAASALAMLDQLLKRPPRGTVCVLLTRAEEDGFIGAIASAARPALLRKTDRIISIECSAEQTYAQQGNGVILRVGDRTSIFNSSFSYFLHRQAEALAKTDKTFKYQRTLMPGGTCEATVFDAFRYTTGAVCIPLRNYHNMDRSRKKIGPEYIDLADWTNMVKLHIQVAKNAHAFEPQHRILIQRLEKRFNARRNLLGKI